MLVFRCFPEIARRGFAKLVRANLAKPRDFCTAAISEAHADERLTKSPLRKTPEVMPRKTRFDALGKSATINERICSDIGSKTITCRKESRRDFLFFSS